MSSIESIKAIQSIIDENKGKISNGDYLQLNQHLLKLFKELNIYDGVDFEKIFVIKYFENNIKHLINPDGSNSFEVITDIKMTFCIIDDIDVINMLLLASPITNVKSIELIPYKTNLFKLNILNDKTNATIIRSSSLNIDLKFSSFQLIDIKKSNQKLFLDYCYSLNHNDDDLNDDDNEDDDDNHD